WWRTLHQPSTVFKMGAEGAPQPAMPAEFLAALLLSLVAMTMLYAVVLLYRLELERRQEELEARLAGE
ncbi:MAG: cytochrome C assembly protein, partial [SAR324 cluster bacterium]|nr:cytochrome C assembly protein [SAR324 cluster bacterium]